MCTFSGSTCGYQINATSNFKWQLFVPTIRNVDENAEESQTKLNPLPINDHTTNGVGSGYLYAESRGFKLNDTATLTSQTYTPLSTNVNESSRCLEFYFYLQGTDSIKLNVKTSSTSNKNIIWSRDYDHSSYWWKGEANIKLLTNYSILFEAVVLNNPLSGIIGLDDIILRNGQCSRYDEV